jgi:hypothetical protein
VILTKTFAIIAIAALAWAGLATWQALSLRMERDDLRALVDAHEAAGRAWESVYRQQEKDGQDAINDTTEWWQAEKSRADGLARERAVRLRDAPSGPTADGNVPEGGDAGTALAACHERLRDAGDEARGAIAEFEGFVAAVRSAAVDDEARRRVLASAPCVLAKP